MRFGHAWVRTTKGEAILADLNRYVCLLSGDGIPRTTEIILSFDDDFLEFSRRLKQLSKEWEAGGHEDSGQCAALTSDSGLPDLTTR